MLPPLLLWRSSGKDRTPGAREDRLEWEAAPSKGRLGSLGHACPSWRGSSLGESREQSLSSVNDTLNRGSGQVRVFAFGLDLLL